MYYFYPWAYYNNSWQPWEYYNVHIKVSLLFYLNRNVQNENSEWAPNSEKWWYISLPVTYTTSGSVALMNPIFLFCFFFSSVHPLCYKIRLKIKFCQWGMYIWNINWIELNSPIIHSAWKRLIFNFQTGFKFYFLQGRGGGLQKIFNKLVTLWKV